MSEEQAVLAPLTGTGAQAAAGSGVLTEGRGGCGPRVTPSEPKRGSSADGGEERAAAERARRESRAQHPTPALHARSLGGRGTPEALPWLTLRRRVGLKSPRLISNQHQPFK